MHLKYAYVQTYSIDNIQIAPAEIVWAGSARIKHVFPEREKIIGRSEFEYGRFQHITHWFGTFE